MLRAEQFNIDSLLRFFVTKNDYTRSNILNILNNLTNDEIEGLGLSYKDLYSFKQDMYTALKEEIVNGNLFNAFNEVADDGDLITTVYYYSSFIETYPLKHILDLRNVAYKPYETPDALWRKINNSNPTNYSQVLGPGTIKDFDSFSELTAEILYSDWESICKVAILDLLKRRNFSANSNQELNILVEYVLSTNPVITDWAYKNDSYLEGKVVYNYEYLSTYGFKYVLYLRNVLDFGESDVIESLWARVNAGNPVKEYCSVNNINAIPLNKRSYYDKEFLEKYGYVMVLTARGINASFDIELSDLKEMTMSSNPEANDAYSQSLLAENRRRAVLSAFINTFIRNRVININDKLFLKQGYANFVGKNLSVEIEHNTGLFPIACLLQQNKGNKFNNEVGNIATLLDNNKLYVFSEGKNYSPFKWTLFFDNNNYLQLVKGSNYNTEYFANTFGSVYIKKIHFEDITKVYDENVNKYVYIINLTKYTTEENLNEVIFINGVSYPIQGNEDIIYDLQENTIKIYNLELKDTDEIAISCLAQKYDKDLDKSVYVNSTSAYSEEIFNGADGVTFKHYMDEKPTMLIITPIIDSCNVNGDKFTKYNYNGFISYKINNDGTITVFNTGEKGSKFRWFAIADETAIKHTTVSQSYFDGAHTVGFTPSTVFFTVEPQMIDPSGEDKIGDLIIEENENSHEIVVSNTHSNNNIKYNISYYDAPFDTVENKSKFLEYTNNFEANEDGKFDASLDSMPNGKTKINYAGEMVSTKIKAYGKNNNSIYAIELPAYNPASFEEGDVVAYNYEKECYEKAHTLNAETIVGIVTKDPAFSTGFYVYDKIQVAIAGIAKIKVLGSVVAGDMLTPSSSKGIAYSKKQKVYKPGTIIAKALEPVTAESNQVNIINCLLMLK